MASQLFAHPMKFEIQITVTFYTSGERLTRRNFFLRNLNGESESGQVAHARQILDSLAYELHYLTQFGIDKGVIRVGGRKVDEVVYPDYRPPLQAWFFIDGVSLNFAPNFAYYWHKQVDKRQQRSLVLPERERDNGWQRQVVRDLKKQTLRIPCRAGNSQSSDIFFRNLGSKKRGRKVVGWSAVFDHTDPVYQQFIGRFLETGNLSLGKERAWVETEKSVAVKGVKWGPPKSRKSTLPRKSKLASKPRDDTDYVYLIRMGRKLIFKIGKTNDPQGRLASLQTASPYKLKLEHVFTADNATAAEETLHGYFHKKRKKGEWFQLSEGERETLMRVTEFCEKRFVTEGERVGVEELFGGGKG